MSADNSQEIARRILRADQRTASQPPAPELSAKDFVKLHNYFASQVRPDAPRQATSADILNAAFAYLQRTRDPRIAGFCNALVRLTTTGQAWGFNAEPPISQPDLAAVAEEVGGLAEQISELHDDIQALGALSLATVECLRLMYERSSPDEIDRAYDEARDLGDRYSVTAQRLSQAVLSAPAEGEEEIGGEVPEIFCMAFAPGNTEPTNARPELHRQRLDQIHAIARARQTRENAPWVAALCRKRRLYSVIELVGSWEMEARASEAKHQLWERHAKPLADAIRPLLDLDG